MNFRRCLWLPALALAALGAAGAAPDDPPAAVPSAFRRFEGTLHGTLEWIQRRPGAVTLHLRVHRAEAVQGSAARAAGRLPLRVPVAVPLDAEGSPAPGALSDALELLRPGQGVRIDVRPAGPRAALYAQAIDLDAAGEPAPPGAAAADVRQLAAELESLRRELARLQREVAELKALAVDLERRARSASDAAR